MVDEVMRGSLSNMARKADLIWLKSEFISPSSQHSVSMHLYPYCKILLDIRIYHRLEDVWKTSVYNLLPSFGVVYHGFKL
jgi:hypothetical protein